MARGQGDSGTPQRRRDQEEARREVPFEPERLIAVLEEAGVSFVLIGGFAAMLHGSTVPTEDIDITPLRDSRNLARLAAALHELGAVPLSAEGEDESWWPIDDQHLRMRDTTHFRTRHGYIDVVINPAAAKGYPDLVNDASPVALPGGSRPMVLALMRIIESKRAADRPKDRAVLPVLEQLIADAEEEEEE